MRGLKLRFAAGNALLVLVGGCTILLAQAPAPYELQYLPRGSHSEGLVVDPKSREGIVLISAIAELSARETFNDWAPELHLRFYLPPGAGQPSVLIRQYQSLADYYQLDNVSPAKPWAAGIVNDFSWTRSVLAKVYDYQISADRRSQVSKSQWLSDLAVLVDLGSKEAGASRQDLVVAPAVIDQSNRPFIVSGYLFTFRTNASATVTGAVHNAAGREVLPGLKYEVTAGSPFTVKWPVKDQAEGRYKLMLDASLAGKPQIAVGFYHKPGLK